MSIDAEASNSIEIWSSSSVSFSSNSLTYDFTNSSSFAFGGNMIQVDSLPVRYAIFSGDINQEGTVDVSDVIEVYNDAVNFAGGYLNTDLNGDNLTDFTDVSIAFNNSSDFVSVISPKILFFLETYITISLQYYGLSNFCYKIIRPLKQTRRFHFRR